MNFDVRSKVVLPVKLLLTIGTFEFLLRRIVDPIVTLQVFVSYEAPMAHVAEELAFLLVVLLPGVPGETVLPHETFAAETAEEFLVLVFTL